MEIRNYNLSDESQVIDLWVKCDLARPWNDPKKDIERKLKIDPDLFLVGVLNSKIIGTVMGGYEGHRGWINYLAIDPSQQRKGYGKIMMKEIEEKLKAKGAPKINIQIRSTNKFVINFYKSINYRIDDVISMGKRLIEDERYRK
ncbi:GNAT family acetyltransferase [Candidatus Aerophobetes bacterium Ae_b3a]|nr:MAG: GNAT family acetyltransferase [Candidatus Aerophobetes bacterium Ae_b3a]